MVRGFCWESDLCRAGPCSGRHRGHADAPGGGSQEFELRLQLASLRGGQTARKAIELLSELLQEDKDNWAVLRSRGDALLSVGKHEEAIEDYNAPELKPDEDGMLNNLAWVLATSPEDKLRDGSGHRTGDEGLRTDEV